MKPLKNNNYRFLVYTKSILTTFQVYPYTKVVCVFYYNNKIQFVFMRAKKPSLPNISEIYPFAYAHQHTTKGSINIPMFIQEEKPWAFGATV